MTDHYELIVGNVGVVYRGNDGIHARNLWAEYVHYSQQDRGRVAGEPITLLKNDNILWDFMPTQTED
jgi:hypothetical protein